jgi:protein involved in polysaccharide export with SLBB domain
LGPGDVLVLVLTGEVELVHQLQVTREGFVVIPQVGQFYVSNMTMSDLKVLLGDRLARSYSGLRRGDTHFDVSIARLRTIQVFVIGEVVEPGAYQLSSVATVLNALYAAGGPTELGNLRQVEVRRAHQVRATLDLYEYLLRGNAAGDIPLEQGDVVFVPVHGSRVSINGAAVRPAIYELAPDETLADLVRMAGGLRPDALQDRLTIFRILPPGERPPAQMQRAVLGIPLQTNVGASSASIPPLRLENGDSVVVDSVPPLDRTLFVTVAGMVNRPGTYPWSLGLTLRDLIRLARGPSLGADLREAEVTRLPENRKTGESANSFRVPLDSSYLFERDSVGAYLGPPGIDFPRPGTAPEVVLSPYDQVTVFRQPGFELQRTAWITGEVSFPGPYALVRRDERVSSLVRRAGGLLPTAHQQGARFFRSLDNTGRLNLDLAALLRRPEQPEDLVLQPGDSLHVPEYVPIVKVEGAVNSPTSVRYEAGKGFQFYIANAGGYASTADKARASVRYADGSARVRSRFLFFSSSPEPGPGSTITVPSRPRGERGIDLAVLFGGISQVLSAVTTIILVVDRLASP